MKFFVHILTPLRVACWHVFYLYHVVLELMWAERAATLDDELQQADTTPGGSVTAIQWIAVAARRDCAELSARRHKRLHGMYSDLFEQHEIEKLPSR